ncbi:MAG: tRNA (adenosine(37)-N6)-threonylcarbamoyltransferase complex dimerization subunit type 1 TsaB [Rhodobacteraceae bacterium]|nr:MAG: tRNA (adenosine(37)-N6)-threonylcarbamoyltransferase complex dimerization subunit type 1 TsaB [Paracoccaceae bacterium]
MAFDTSGPFVSIAATWQTDTTERVEDMARGQAEALFPLLEEELARWKWTWSDLDALGVVVGPGNFTGIRISVSAARGLALALDIPVFGITNFENACGHVGGVGRSTLVSLPAPRGMAYVQAFGHDCEPRFGNGRLIDPANPPKDLQMSFGMSIIGHRAEEMAQKFEAHGCDDISERQTGLIAAIAARKYHEASAPPPPPAPLYIRPADAAPSRDVAPVILDDA